MIDTFEIISGLLVRFANVTTKDLLVTPTGHQLRELSLGQRVDLAQSRIVCRHAARIRARTRTRASRWAHKNDRLSLCQGVGGSKKLLSRVLHAGMPGAASRDDEDVPARLESHACHQGVLLIASRKDHIEIADCRPAQSCDLEALPP